MISPIVAQAVRTGGASGTRLNNTPAADLTLARPRGRVVDAFAPERLLLKNRVWYGSRTRDSQMHSLVLSH